MKKIIAKVKMHIMTQKNKLHKLPPHIKMPTGIGLVILGVVNIFNPIINGVFIIIIGASLVSTSFYNKEKY